VLTVAMPPQSLPGNGDRCPSGSESPERRLRDFIEANAGDEKSLWWSSFCYGRAGGLGCNADLGIIGKFLPTHVIATPFFSHTSVTPHFCPGAFSASA